MSQKNNHVDLVKTGRSYGSVRDPVSAPSKQVKVSKKVVRDSISAGSKFSLFALLVGVVLVVSLVKSMVGADPLTFGGLLDTLASAPSVDMSLSSFEVIPSIVGWGTFQFIADFINFFITIWNVQIYVFKGLYSVVAYLFYFITFLFVG